MLVGAAYVLIVLGLGTLLPAALWLGLSTVALSLLSFAQYGWDKSLAKRGARRIPERQMHVLAVLGGWPGALVARRVFRHKTVKPSFQLAFRVAIVLNVALTIAACFLLR